MILDDSIILKYINGYAPETYNDCWIYSAFGSGHNFNSPDNSKLKWVEKLYEKLKKQISNYIPHNSEIIYKLFPDFDYVADNYTIMLVVGLPDPYDAMVLNHQGKNYMIFDLIQFGERCLDEKYSCHKVLTHELLHMCLYNKYPKPCNLSYIDELSYTAFDEGFAHAVSFPDDINTFCFDNTLEEKYLQSKAKMIEALKETDIVKQKEYLASADTGNYWDKFASICGKLYLLKHIYNLSGIYEKGWHDFSKIIIN